MRRDALLTLSTQAGIQLAGLATGILVARFLGPTGRGELAAIIAWVSMISYLGNLGLPVAYTFAAAREPNRGRQLHGNGIVAVLLQWPTLAIIGWAVITQVFAKQGGHILELALVYLCFYIPVNLLTLYTNAIHQGLGQYYSFNIVRACVPAIYLVGLSVLCILGKINVPTVLAANLFGNLLALALSLALIIPRIRDQAHGQRTFDLARLWRDARFGLSAHLGTLQPFNGLRIDVLLLALLLPRRGLGLYMAALAGAALIKAQGMALGMVVMPEVAKCSERKAQRKLLLRFGGFAFILGSATATVALIWADYLIRLVYGDAFSDAAPTLRVLALGAVAGSVYRVAADGLRGMGQPLSATTAELASLVVGISAIFLIVPSNGALGAGVAVGLASVAALLVTIHALFRRSSCRNSHQEGIAETATDVPRPIGKAD